MMVYRWHLVDLNGAAGAAQANETEKKVVEAFDDFSRVLTLDSSNRCALVC